ncbi:MAG: ATP-binding protein [Cyclobacteriaceae bacterium]|nr:ATP-binding protein [Cyclobacteriaceae bacterium]
MKHNITISCSKTNLTLIRDFVNATLSTYGINEIETHKLVLAVDEVCANLIIHANQCNTGQHLELGIDVAPGSQILFVIRDNGTVFDITKYNAPSLDEIVSSKRKGGLGLLLVKRIMDKIEFTTEKNHNICTLIKNL